MNIIRKLVNFICALALALTGLYFTISLCILFFIFTGRLEVGYEFSSEDRVPGISTLLLFQAACIFIMATLVLIRAKVGNTYDFTFLKPEDE
jgi:hypothetical protein